MDGNKSDNFGLRCTLSGHDREIRSIAPLSQPDGAFVSICTERIVQWAPERNGIGFSGETVVRCQCNAVHSLCVVPPNDEHPSGLVLVGTDEPSIQAYVAPSDQPTYTLREHRDIVCSLAAGRYGTVVSGSWDKTAKVWYKEKCTMTLSGHEGAILSILLMPVGGYMLTGSADSSIKRWRAGKCEQTFEGHTDWVRALCLLSQSEFLSCSNDGTVRRWNISGGCLQTCSGHSGSVLGLACLPEGKGFVSVGEDGKMNVWKDGKQVQLVISESQQSMSSVCVLPNGDVVTGASDSLIRVFTTDPECIAAEASPEKQECIAAEMSPEIPECIAAVAHTETTSSETGETETAPSDKATSLGEDIVQRSELSCNDPESAAEGRLSESALPPSASGKDISITSSALSDKSNGEITGSLSSEAQKPSRRKVVFEGKEYDFVFDVELGEGNPAMKLPFSLTEKPEVAAESFLDRNELSPKFLQDVVSFIRAQSGLTSGVEEPKQLDSGSSGSHQTLPKKALPGEYFPETSYITFENMNKKGVFSKLREFNFEVPPEKQMNKAEMVHLESLTSGLKGVAPEVVFPTLWKLLSWTNPDMIFPALDLLRYAVLCKSVNSYLCTSDEGGRFIDYISSILSNDSTPPRNQFLVLRALCNTFQHAPGERLMLSSYDRLASHFLQLPSDLEPHLQIAQSSLLLNFVIAFCLVGDTDGKMRCLSGAVTLSQSLTDPEAYFRLLVAIGTAVIDDRSCHKLARTLDLQNFFNMCCCDDSEKVRSTAQSITKRVA